MAQIRRDRLAAAIDGDVRRIRLPVSLLRGSADPFGGAETGRAGGEFVSEVEFQKTGRGHRSWLDEPAICGERLGGFFDQEG